MPVPRSTSPADLTPRAFSTAGLPDARRVELWETHNATALIGLDVQSSEPLFATEVNLRLPRVDLARVHGSAHMVRRTRRVIERSPTEAIVVYLTLRGDASFECPDKTYALRPGNAIVCDTDQPFAREFRHGLEELVVKVDRGALPDIPQLGLPVITSFHDTSATNRYARALATITSRAARTEQSLLADEGTVLDLIAVLAGGRAAAPASAHRAVARSYIEEHLANPGLGAADVAAAIGISERQLSRVFAADGTSIPRHILSRRLHLAYTLLSADQATTGSVADVAARCGFTSMTYFSHVFRQHFGHRATEVRRSARERPAPKF
jgi:AraC-like DNA-binding protein